MTTEIAALLIKHGGKTGEELKAELALLNAAFKGNIEAVKKHLADVVDVNAMSDATGMTPLDYAASKNHKETADLLRKHGGKTADELNDTAIIDLLRKHGGKTGEELKAEGK